MKHLIILLLVIPFYCFSQNKVQISQIDHSTIGAVAEIENATITNLNSSTGFTDYNLTTVNYNDLGTDITMRPSGFISNIEGTYEVCYSAGVAGTGQRVTTNYVIDRSDGERYYLGSSYIRNASSINEMPSSGCAKVKLIPTQSISFKTKREGTVAGAVNPIAIGAIKLTIERTY